MPDNSNVNYPELYPVLLKSRWVVADLASDIAAIDLERLYGEYRSLRERAPSRPTHGMKYFDDQEGNPSIKGDANLRGDHCAMALVNLQRVWKHPRGGNFRYLDCQFPLKALQSDIGIGRIDIVGVDHQKRFILTNLKVEGETGSRGDAPPLALLEGLSHAAIVEANLDSIVYEVKGRFDVELQQIPPVIQILGTWDWWSFWLNCPPVGEWQREFVALVDGIQKEFGVFIDCLAMDRLRIFFDGEGERPRFRYLPSLMPVEM